jgi:NTP pyrophosphatase (non-canonical NTP hydrolase)
MILNIEKIAEKLQKFASERDWDQFHTPKNLATSISVESSELLEIFQWTRGQKDWNEISEVEVKEKIEHEVADILLYLIRFADLAKIDLEEVALRKIEINAKKYPIETSKGSDKKYNEK